MTTKNKSQSSIKPPPGVDATKPTAVAQSINEHFVSIGSDIRPLDVQELPAFLPASTPVPMLYPWEVYNKLSKLNTKKAGGPDGISAKLIREFAYEISIPLTDILNSSFSEGVVPTQWKRAVVVPIPKSSPPTWNQLRPVSLTDHFAKVAEAFLIGWLMDDIEDEIDVNQFGNRKGHSTSHYLVKLLNNIFMHAEKPSSISRIVITDFSKAFDRVDHNIAIPKLIKMGARPAIIPWICSFLSQRSQCVRYQDNNSPWLNLSGGVPQGTLAGPATFVAQANDAALTYEQNKMALKYVDDLTIVENTFPNKTSTIQNNLKDFDEWANMNKMNLNPKKCMYMDVSFTRDPCVLEPLRLSGEELQSTDIVKILGIKISKDLKWDVHISDIIKRASGRLFMLTTLRRFGLPVEDLKTIYIGFIRPLVEYAVPAWHPGLSEQQHAALERIQKRACRIMLGNKYDSYVDALEQCKLTRLRSRREQICLQFMDKLMKNPAFRSWLPRSRGEDTGRSLRNSHLLSIPKTRTERYARSPIPYMVRLWNAEASKV